MENNRLPIPKIIHQIWLGPHERPVEWMETWREKNPDWEYKLWTDDNLPRLFNQEPFDKIQAFSGKADILRVELLYHYGGIYLDSDCECLNPLDDDLRKYPCFVCYENELVRPGLIQNGVVGSAPKHPFLETLIEEISKIEDFNKDVPSIVVGPYFWTRVLRRFEIFNGFIDILPSYKFTPIHLEGSCYLGSDKVYANHYWTGRANRDPTKDEIFKYDPDRLKQEKEQLEMLKQKGKTEEEIF